MPELPGLPSDRIGPWLREHLPERFTGDWDAELISGGLSNITYRIVPAGGEAVILRRPPLGEVLPSAHDMRREHRVLTALGGTAVPVPQTLALCTDEEVLGRPFYVMTEARGRVLRTAADTAELPPALRSELADRLITTLADLHAIEPAAVGLADYGRPDGYAARQLRRWGGQWEKSRTRDLPDMDRLLARLAERLPAQTGSALVHGDYRLDNTVVDLTGPARITAVLDWELCTLGDPLADLGVALSYWHDPGDDERGLIPVAAGVTAHEGFPRTHELAERYARLTGRDLTTLPFHLALASMKLAVILEGVHARFLGGKTVTAGYDDVGDAVPVLVARGLRRLDESGV
ncbi:phosphotransferase family protein [Dactylosporangium sp. NPDC000521]|uniref:phosphotransferase family protein n=1 Tax=Dactylosporangium sp. NPDC000521 TaxID=3363975 RepID=UPI0036C808B7